MHHYLPQQLGVAGHQLSVLLLQLVVPLLRGLGPFCTGEKKVEMTVVCAAEAEVAGAVGKLERVPVLVASLSASKKVLCKLSCSRLRCRVASSSMRSCSFSTRARCFCARCSSSSASRLLIWDLSWVM